MKKFLNEEYGSDESIKRSNKKVILKIFLNLESFKKITKLYVIKINLVYLKEVLSAQYLQIYMHRNLI